MMHRLILMIHNYVILHAKITYVARIMANQRHVLRQLLPNTIPLTTMDYAVEGTTTQ